MLISLDHSELKKITFLALFKTLTSLDVKDKLFVSVGISK